MWQLLVSGQERAAGVLLSVLGCLHIISTLGWEVGQFVAWHAFRQSREGQWVMCGSSWVHVHRCQCVWGGRFVEFVELGFVIVIGVVIVSWAVDGVGARLGAPGAPQQCVVCWAVLSNLRVCHEVFSIPVGFNGRRQIRQCGAAHDTMLGPAPAAP